MSGGRPTGTVTFLFTDIEGSTRLWDEWPADMASALERHDAIIRDAVDRHDGHVFTTGGDGYGAVFQRAERAVSAAVDAQLSLLDEPWPELCPIRVRMGVHSGETRERDGDYFGPTVNRSARIMAAARPTQILVSDVTRGVITEYGLDEVGFDVAGTVVLRGTADRATLHSVVGAGLPTVEQTPLSAGSEGNLVAPLSSFVGRAPELAGILRALDDHRLVTLIGVGGVGKTRLAIEAGLETRSHHDGVWLVELGLIDAADEVSAAVSDALRLLPTPGVGFDESVAEWCATRDLLVVLDNCEHVIGGAASFVSSLLTAAPQVKVLATSREPLMLTGEHIVPVPSLSLHGPGDEMSEAVDFFVDRARSELPAFDAVEHLEDIRDICARLDGIPLALELAAARLRGLSVSEISRRLDERFRLLTGGRSGSVERHATLRATVNWSYDLLDDAEQDLFERLAVFAGRFGVDDVVGLHGEDADEYEIIDTLAALVNRSLVVRDDRQPEYRMLETLRAYGRERLTSSNRIDEVRSDHAQLMAAKARRHRALVAGPQEAVVAVSLEAQLPDYGAAAEWAIGAAHPELAVSIAWDCLQTSWGSDEMRRWLDPLMPADDNEQPWLPDALTVAAHSALFYDADTPTGAALAERAIALDPTHSFAHAQACIAAMFSGEVDKVVAHGRRSLDTATDTLERTLGFMVLGNALFFTGRFDEASTVVDELRLLGDSSGFPTAIATVHHLAGRLLAETDPEAALVEFRAGLDAVNGLDRFVAESNLRREMIPALMRTDPQAARRAAVEFLASCDQRNDTGQVNNGLGYLVTILHDLDEPELAAETAGHVGHPLLAPSSAAQYHKTEHALRELLGETYETHAAAGRARRTTDLIRSILDVLAASAD